MQTPIILCPKCGYEVDVEEVLLRRLEEQQQQERKAWISEREKAYQLKDNAIKQQKQELEKQSQELKKQSEDLERQSLEKAKAIVAESTPALEAKIKAQCEEQYETQLKSLADENAESKKKIAEWKTTQIENERLKRQLDEKEQDLKLKFEREKSEFVKEETLKIQQRQKESTDLVIQELKKQLDDQKKLADEMKRKAEQGSQQSQGEIQEIALEKMLRDLYEIEGDEIMEVKKGQRGADLIHVVKTRQGDVCGKIYYESKRTQEFQNAWLQKLRDDNLEVNADVLVIVTKTMPAGQDRFFCKDSVWICPFAAIKEFSMVLRFAIMQTHFVSVVQQGKDEKMEMIYDYLTGNEFAGQFGAILEGFKALQDNYATEKLRMEKIWKEREKQLEKILANAARFYGSIKGIAGQSIPNIKMLEEDTTPLLEE